MRQSLLEKAYQKDVARAERAIEVLARCPYPELHDAAHAEMARLLAFLDQPEKLWAIYRRRETRLPYAYGMVQRTGEN